MRSPRDFRRALAGERCWDLRTQRIYEAQGEPRDDCMLQCRDELIELCAFIERKHVRSYLEVGVWTGRTLSALHRIFEFDRVAACDHGWARDCGLHIAVPEDAEIYWGNAESEGYRRFREALGPIDLVLIDANHHYGAVRRDFEINRALPHRFLAFHDIAGTPDRKTGGVAKFWQELDEGYRFEIRHPNRAIGATRPTMGIGIWSASEDPAS
jgi:hypothetical protein